MLLSKNAMKKASIKIDLANDTVKTFESTEKLITTMCGYYCMSLLGASQDRIKDTIQEVLANDLVNIDEKQQFKVMDKMHKQVGHTVKDKFMSLMKDTNVWHEGLEKHLCKIISKFDLCIKKMRNPHIPVVK